MAFSLTNYNLIVYRGAVASYPEVEYLYTVIQNLFLLPLSHDGPSKEIFAKLRALLPRSTPYGVCIVHVHTYHTRTRG